MEKNFRTFGGNFSPGLSKLHSACPEEHYEEFFNKIIILYLFLEFERKMFGLMVKNSRSFGEKFSAGLLKLHSTWPDEYFGDFRKKFQT